VTSGSSASPLVPLPSYVDIFFILSHRMRSRHAYIYFAKITTTKHRKSTPNARESNLNLSIIAALSLKPGRTRARLSFRPDLAILVTDRKKVTSQYIYCIINYINIKIKLWVKYISFFLYADSNVYTDSNVENPTLRTGKKIIYRMFLKGLVKL